MNAVVRRSTRRQQLDKTLALAALLLALQTPAVAATIYVNAASTGANNGSSWPDAFADLQSALAAAQSGDEIWVAAGTYKPTSGADRTISFNMKTGVALYGGFVGTETERGQRDWTAHETILSGDIGVFGINSDNTYHVVKGANSGTLDGYTITSGNANGVNDRSGGGILNIYVSPKIQNCTIVDNIANYAGYGYGAGLYNLFNTATATNCIFSHNTAASEGGGVVAGNATITLVNCIFANNEASLGGGVYAGGATLTMLNCTLTGNRSDSGGGICSEYSSSVFINCILWEDYGISGSESYYHQGDSLFKNCAIRGSGGSGSLWNSALGRDGGGNITYDPQFFDASSAAGSDQIWGTSDDGLRLRQGSPCIDAGISSGVPALDILGNPRVRAADLGAFENQSEKTTHDMPLPKRIYVNASASGENTGVDWQDAFADLNDALESADWGDVVWVVAGTYKPTGGVDRTKSIALQPGVLLYGGFNGSETLLEQRDAIANMTILSGDIGIPGNSQDNSDRVVMGAHQAVLNGFTIEGGGKGLTNNYVSPILENCVFRDNRADGGGSGIININASPMIQFCLFKNNSAVGSSAYGGGILNSGGSPSILDCVFFKNTAGSGGAVYDYLSSPTLNRCLFQENSAGGSSDNSGGAIYSVGGKPHLIDCVIEGNTAAGGITGGGGGIYDYTSSTVAENCTFSRNISYGAEGGGGFCAIGGYPTIIGCTFSENSAIGPHGCGGAIFGAGIYGEVKNCSFTENSALLAGGGIEARDFNSANIEDCAFAYNTAGHTGGGIDSGLLVSFSVVRCVFIGNSAAAGGGMSNYSNATPNVEDCAFTANSAINGGGMYTDSATPTLINCSFYENSATSGGGAMDNHTTSLNAVNCTFADNSAKIGGGVNTAGMYYTILINCILWDDHATTGTEIFGGRAVFQSCDARGCNGSGASWNAEYGLDGLGNREFDPKFFDVLRPAGGDGIWLTADDGLRLTANSRCIDAGRASGAPLNDILGVLRTGRPDIGAYEFVFVPSAAPDWALYR